MSVETAPRRGAGLFTRPRLVLATVAVFSGMASTACRESSPGPSIPAKIVKVSGDGQQAEVAAAIPGPLVVRVVDADGRPTPGVGLTFQVSEGNGTLASVATQTDSTGTASARWTLGTAAGTAHKVIVRGTTSTLDGVTFGATALPGRPAALTAVSGGDQSAAPGRAVLQPLVVRATDQYGNVTPGKLVHFEISSGGGRMLPDSVATDAAGEARSQWTLGLTEGTQSVNARISELGGVSVRFAAVASGVCAGDAIALRTDFLGIDDGSKAADVTIAAGPGSLVLARNLAIAIRHKTGALLEQKSMASFFSSVRGPGFNRLTDPYVIYDPSSSRFFVATADGKLPCAASGCEAYIMLAVSKSATPATLTGADWNFYIFDRNRHITAGGTFPNSTQFGDFDHLGVTNDLLVIGMDLERDVNGVTTYLGMLRVFDKKALVRGDPVNTWFDFSDLPQRPIPATLRAVSDRLLVYFKPRCNAPTAQLMLGAVEGTPAQPTLTMVEASTPAPCPDFIPNTAEQPGGVPIDVQHLNVAPVQTADRLWIARMVGATSSTGPTTAIRWTEVDISRWPATSVVQEGTFQDELRRYAPALAVDASNNMVMVYAGSGPGTFAGTYYTGRLAQDAPNTLRAQRTLKAGEAAFSQIIEGRNRFTDYFSVAPDPVDGSFWAMGMFAHTGQGSGTWVGNFVACP